VILAIQDNLYFEGDERQVHAIYPRPLIIGSRFEETSLMSETSRPSYVKTLFREDAFDPAVRIRRGRFYLTASDESSRSWFPGNVSFYPYPAPLYIQQALRQGPTASQPSVMFRAEAYRPLQLNELPLHLVGSFVHLGESTIATKWRIIQVEQMVDAELLFTMKAQSSFGVLPNIVIENIPEECRATVAKAVESVVDIAHRHTGASVVDVCREAAVELWRCKYPHSGSDTKDLAKLIGPYEKGRINCIQSAATIINALHSRGKSSARNQHHTREVSVEDSEFAVQAIGFLLQDFGWAEA
jgi:hypothetical protein